MKSSAPIAAAFRNKRYRFTALFCMAVMVMFFIRECDHICIGDELRYFYRFQLQDGETYFRFDNISLTRSAGDIAASMVNHYEHVNGRIPVHALEQAFSSLWGLTLFYVLNACVFMLTVCLAVRLCAAPGYRLRMTVLCTGVFLYLFPSPGRLWLSVNLALNYLWPACATLALTAALPRLEKGGYRRLPVVAALAMLTFFLGWSNEAFSFPVSGALALWAWRRRRSLCRQAWIVIICLWAGALIMVCSPGNWNRASSAPDLAGTYWPILKELRLVWILAAVTLILSVLRLWRKDLTVGWRRSPVIPFLWTTLVLALAFSFVAHTATRAMTCIELMSALLLLSLVPRGLPDRLSAVLGVIIIAHQGLVTAEHHRQYISIKEATIRYERSVSGTVIYDYEPPSWLTRRFVYSQLPTNRGAAYEWRLLGVYLSGGQAKPFTAITAETMDSLRHLAPMSPARIDGGWALKGYSQRFPAYKLLSDKGEKIDALSLIFRLDSVFILTLTPPPGVATVSLTL